MGKNPTYSLGRWEQFPFIVGGAIMKTKADLCVTYISLLAITMMLLVNGCNKEDNQDEKQAFDENSDVQLRIAESGSEFENDVKNYLISMVETENSSTGDRAEISEPLIISAVGAEQAVNTSFDDGSAVADAAVPASLSETNLVDQGVDEADIVKSDGLHLFIGRQGSNKFIYYDQGGIEIAVDEASVAIDTVDGRVVDFSPTEEFKAEPASIRIMALDNDTPSASETSVISLPERVSHILGLYISEKTAAGKAKQITVVASGTSRKDDTYYRLDNTQVISFDVSNPAKPEKLWDFEVEGNHHASRSMNGKLYLISSKRFWNYIRANEVTEDGKLISGVDNYKSLISDIQIEDILPASWVNGEKAEIVKANNCMVPKNKVDETLFSASLLTVYTIPVNSPDETKALCTVESSTEVYVSTNAIYFTKGEYVYSRDESIPSKHYTVIHKLAFTDDSVAYKSSIRIPGWTGWRSRSFRMNELKGDLRIVVTDYESVRTEVVRGATFSDAGVPEPAFEIEESKDESDGSGSDGDVAVMTNQSVPSNGDSEDDPDRSVELVPIENIAVETTIIFEQRPVHRLFVLREDVTNNDKLSILSQLPNKDRPKAIGKPGEDVYAVRYFGGYAYIVTFRNTDPLYAINLKSPEDPFIEGELTIPGYSDYLHPINDNLLFGVGREATEEGRLLGVKMALFDVTDKSNPVTIKSMTLGKRSSDTAASNDHHAFTILSDYETGIHRVALPVTVYDREVTKVYEHDSFTYYDWSYTGLQLLEVDDGSQSTVASMSNAGVMKAAESSSENKYRYSSEPRSLIVDDALHYVDNAKVWSALWEEPEKVNGPN